MKKGVFYAVAAIVFVGALTTASCSNDSSNEDQSLYENIDPAADVDPTKIKKPGGGS